MSRAVPLDRIRNIGIVARADAGKTTTTERILNIAGNASGADVSTSGVSDKGVSDEIAVLFDRAITISSAATSCRWRDCVVTIVHTPQSRELTAEAERALRVLDGLVVVLDGSADGVPGWGRTERLTFPRLCFINKMDAEGADFRRAVAEAGRQLEATMLVCQLPVMELGRFVGVVDLVAEETRSWHERAVVAVSAGTMEVARDARERLLETLGLAAGAAVEAVRSAIREGVIAGRFVPVVCGSAYESLGIGPLLDAIVDYLPSPADVATLKGVGVDRESSVRRQASDEAPFAGLTFNSLEDPAVGPLTFVRVYSGVLKVGARVLNPSRQAAEEIGRLVRIHANHREDIEEARTGDIVALTGLKHSRAGDTLCDPVEPVIITAGDLPAKVA